jgi:hypothetical protein
MVSNRRLRIVQMVLIGAILLVAAGQSSALQVGDKAPDFDLPATTTKSIKLADYLGQKPVVLFFYIGAFTNRLSRINSDHVILTMISFML